MEKGAHWSQPVLTHGYDHPIWFCRDGLEMQLDSSYTEGILIFGERSQLVIRTRNTDGTSICFWDLSWQIQENDQCYTKGTRVFSKRDIEAAFGLIDYVQETPDCHWIIRQYGGNSAAAGKFLRWKEFLNIPGPGTGRSGDPNLSIKINSVMQEGIRQLLSRQILSPT